MLQLPFLNLNNGSAKAALSISRYGPFHSDMELRTDHNVVTQDLMARFTLDSATEFLFGSCVDSLTAGLPYPHNVAPPPSFIDSNAFAKALLEAQTVVAIRERAGPIWPLEEIWKDKTQKPMQVVDGYVEPIIQEALARMTPGKFDRKVASEHFEEGETLLDHLVQVTEGRRIGILAETLMNVP